MQLAYDTHFDILTSAIFPSIVALADARRKCSVLRWSHNFSHLPPTRYTHYAGTEGAGGRYITD